jgi:hypothetical protein
MSTLLTLDERRGAAWQRLRKHIDMRIDVLRRINDNDADAATTAKTRGRIAELRRLLADADPDTQNAGEDKTT